MKKANVSQEKNIKATIETILKSDVSKSNKMKQLFDAGLEVKEIASLMQVRYNFVYNVVSNHININEIETVKSEKNTKKDEVLKMYEEGMKVVEIAKALKTNYNYIHKIVKEHKQTTNVETVAK